MFGKRRCGDIEDSAVGRCHEDGCFPSFDERDDEEEEEEKGGRGEREKDGTTFV